MAKDASYLEFSESANWNVARNYAELKIMKWLYLADEYEVIATFGSSELIDEFVVDENTMDFARLKAIKRLNKTLLMIINNTIFAVKKKDRPELEKYKQDLLALKKVLPACEKKITNQKDKTVKIKVNEEIFQRILDILIEIKASINEPLNKADLIFSSIEEFDPDKMKAELMEDIVFSG